MQSKVIAVWFGVALAATLGAGCGTSNDDGESMCQSFLETSLITPADATCETVDVNCNGPSPQQAPCMSSCSSLTESECLGTAECHAAYVAATADGNQQFFACWQVARIGLPGPVQDGACHSLDADGCASQEICLSRYVGSDAAKTFSSCADVSSLGNGSGD